MSEIIRAPWTAGQVASLNSFQESEVLHAYTCRSLDCNLAAMEPESDRMPLAADEDGLHCIEPYPCGYVQDWAYASTLDWSWREQERQAGRDRGRAARKSYRALKRDLRGLRTVAGLARRDAVRLAVTVLILAAIIAVAHSSIGHWRFP